VANSSSKKLFVFLAVRSGKKMTLTRTEMTSANGKTFMLTANADKPRSQSQKQARIRQNALIKVRFAECGLFA
jgi:hypothetical protein